MKLKLERQYWAWSDCMDVQPLTWLYTGGILRQIMVSAEKKITRLVYNVKFEGSLRMTIKLKRNFSKHHSCLIFISLKTRLWRKCYFILWYRVYIMYFVLLKWNKFIHSYKIDTYMHITYNEQILHTYAFQLVGGVQHVDAVHCDHLWLLLEITLLN